jgi:hypothetical protein
MLNKCGSKSETKFLITLQRKEATEKSMFLNYFTIPVHKHEADGLKVLHTWWRADSVNKPRNTPCSLHPSRPLYCRTDSFSPQERAASVMRWNFVVPVRQNLRIENMSVPNRRWSGPRKNTWPSAFPSFTIIKYGFVITDCKSLRRYKTNWHNLF